MSEIYGHLQQLSCIRLQKLDFFKTIQSVFYCAFLVICHICTHCDQFFKVIPCSGFCVEDAVNFYGFEVLNATVYNLDALQSVCNLSQL